VPEQDDPAQYQALNATPSSPWAGGSSLSTSKDDATFKPPAHLPEAY
jgi:hypothetical protein